MTAYTWAILLLNAAPYFIGAGIIVLVIMIYKIWRLK